jgi:sugar lactone lactonase YvrE
MHNRMTSFPSWLAGMAASLPVAIALATFGSLAVALVCASPVFAGPPTHLRAPALDVDGLNRACGVAVDTQGDLYASSAGESKVNVYDPEHTLLTSIPDVNTPCGLAVTATGNLYVSEQATGEVVRFKPSAYPFSGSPAYGPREVIDASGAAKGISVDRADNRLYVAEADRVAVYEADGSPAAADEVQGLQVFEATGGTYTLSFEGSETTPIPYNATAAEVQAALQALVTIGAGNVSVSGGEVAGESNYTIVFEGALSAADVEKLQADGSALDGGPNVQVNTSEMTKGFSGQVGKGLLAEASGVAVYTSPGGSHFLWVADADGLAADKLYLFGGASYKTQALRRELTGAAAPEGSFEFGPAGASLAIDPGNKETGGSKCAAIEEQACTAGHLLVYDAGHQALDEFDAGGEYLDRMSGPEFADAEPSGIAVERSGGDGDGTIYLGAGAGTGAKLLAFSPLAAPSRAPLEAEPPSHLLEDASRDATDSRGDLYVAAGKSVHVFGPDGNELTTFDDPQAPFLDIGVDSTGKVYVVEENTPGGTDNTVTYYTPSSYPPGPGTTYARHDPIVESGVAKGWPASCEDVAFLAVDPISDHVFVMACSSRGGVRELDSAANGSSLLNGEFAAGLQIAFGQDTAIDVDGASGDVYFASTNGQSTITVVNAAGTEVLARINGAGAPRGQLEGRLSIAVDQSNGHVLAFANTMGGGREYDASGVFVAEFAFPEPKGFTTNLVAPSDIAIDNACALHRNGSDEAAPLTEETTPTCAEYDPADGRAYVAFDDTKPGTPDVWAFGPLNYGAPPQTRTGTASGFGGGGVTLNGAVNPEGFQVEGCEFEYLQEAAYQHNLEEEEPPFAGAEEALCEDPGAAELGAGTSAEAVHVSLASLVDSEGRYRFRLCAANRFGEACGAPGLFGPPEAITGSALPALYTEATLHGEVEPAGLATSYHFEYRRGEGAYDSTPTHQLAAGEGSIAVQAPLNGLAEATTYSFRLVAESEDGTATGSERQFTTLQRRAAESCPNAEYRTGLSAALPDCRAYELVTPEQTGSQVPTVFHASSAGQSDSGFSEWYTPPRSASTGGRLAYLVGGTLPGFDGNGNLDGYLANRGAGSHPEAGWQTELFGPSYEEASPDISSPVVEQGLAPDQLFSFWLVQPARTFPATLPEGGYLQVRPGTTNPACNPQPAQHDFELVGCGDLGTDPVAQGHYVSAEGSHVIFRSTAHLEAAAPPAGVQALYDRPAGSVHAEVLSTPPAGASPALQGAFESTDAVYAGASEDGSDVVFKLGGALYLHHGGQTIEVAPSPATFAGISPDGSRVFYAATESREAAASLYLCELSAGPCAGEGAHAPVQVVSQPARFVAVDEAAAAALFLSETAIPDSGENENSERPEAGADNLYRWQAAAGATDFLARLAPADLVGFGGDPEQHLGTWTTAIAPGAPGRATAPVRTTPGGGVAAFQSHARLTSYDNTGPCGAEGESGPCGEIYRYAPGAPAGQRLLCISCDPTGSPPRGEAFLQTPEFGESHVDSFARIANITDGGDRVFFESPDRLVPEDANLATDVYEWTAEGTAGCSRPVGCLALISSGQGERGSYLFSMSTDGQDVFFSTTDKLVGADLPGTPSIYDAREGGGIPEPTVAAPCSGDACQGEGAGGPALPAPATTGSGGGNVEKAKRRCPKGRHAVRRHGKTHCVKRGRHHRHRHHRRSHPKPRRGR